MVEIHIHPMVKVRRDQVIFGRRLRAGETIQEGDVYDSTTGKWEKAPCPGLVIAGGCTTYWVRPESSGEERKKIVIVVEAVTNRVVRIIEGQDHAALRFEEKVREIFAEFSYPHYDIIMARARTASELHQACFTVIGWEDVAPEVIDE